MSEHAFVCSGAPFRLTYCMFAQTVLKLSYPGAQYIPLLVPLDLIALQSLDIINRTLENSSFVGPNFGVLFGEQCP